MKHTLFFTALFLSSIYTSAWAQPLGNAGTCESKCECEGGITEMQVYYFSDTDADINVYSNFALSDLIASFPGQTNGDLLTVTASSLPGGTFGNYIYFRINYADGEDCTIRIYSRCPTNAWPGALEDLNVLGQAFGDLTPFAYTSSGKSEQCTISDTDQDWQVGGNIVAPDNTRLGTRNNQPVSLITNDTERAVLTTDGRLGLGLNSPSALLDVEGDARVAEALDVFGTTTVHDNTSSSSAGNGALVIEGGAGIGENANIGQNLDVDGTATVGNNFTVEATGTASILSVLQSTGSDNGALTVAGGAGIDRNLNVGENLDVNGTATVGNDFTVEAAGTASILSLQQSTEPDNGALVVNGGAGINRNLNIGGITRIGTLNAPAIVGGESTSGYHLFVAGGILTEEVLVRTGWADYVFEDDYDLRPLREVEAFIQANGHLPDVPSAAEIENNGLTLGANAKNQQVKIEELFLYLIEMNKEIEELKEENELLKAKIQDR